MDPVPCPRCGLPVRPVELRQLQGLCLQCLKELAFGLDEDLPRPMEDNPGNPDPGQGSTFSPTDN